MTVPVRFAVILVLCLLSASALAAQEAVTQKSRQAFQALRPLAEEGNPVAQHQLGVMYRTGKGAPQNFKLAAKWFRMAADKGMAPAQNNLGGLYATGQGVEKDYVLAYKWFSLAANQNLAEARTNRDRIAREMTPAQVARGKKLVSRWRPARIPEDPAP